MSFQWHHEENQQVCGSRAVNQVDLEPAQHVFGGSGTNFLVKMECSTELKRFTDREVRLVGIKLLNIAYESREGSTYTDTICLEISPEASYLRYSSS